MTVPIIKFTVYAIFSLPLCLSCCLPICTSIRLFVSQKHQCWFTSWVIMSAVIATDDRPTSQHVLWHKCHGNRHKRTQLCDCCLSNHWQSRLTDVSSVESIERDVRRLENVRISFIFLCICSRWGNTSQTCMRTWEMDTTWSPCSRSSLELP